MVSTEANADSQPLLCFWPKLAQKVFPPILSTANSRLVEPPSSLPYCSIATAFASQSRDCSQFACENASSCKGHSPSTRMWSLPVIPHRRTQTQFTIPFCVPASFPMPASNFKLQVCDGTHRSASVLLQSLSFVLAFCPLLVFLCIQLILVAPALLLRSYSGTRRLFPIPTHTLYLKYVFIGTIRYIPHSLYYSSKLNGSLTPCH